MYNDFYEKNERQFVETDLKGLGVWVSKSKVKLANEHS